MKALITGGAGFIGSHLADSFANQGHQVTILDNLSTGSLSNLSQVSDMVNFVEGDIRDNYLVENLIQNVDVVFHLAAAVGVQTIMNHTVESVSTNFSGSEIVIKAALKYGKRIILASTSEIYGKNSKQPLVETDDRVVGNPQKIRWTYADAKALEEAVAFSLFLTNGLRMTILRFFNTVGPRQTGRYGMVLPIFASRALKNEEIPIHGNGDQSRVFCHVFDVVKAIHLVTFNDATIGEVYNVGGLDEITMNHLAHKIIKQTNSASNICFIPYSQAYPSGYEDMQRRVPDISKIQSHLGWEPTYSIDSIIRDVIEAQKI